MKHYEMQWNTIKCKSFEKNWTKHFFLFTLLVMLGNYKPPCIVTIKMVRMKIMVNCFYGWSRWARVNQNQVYLFKTHFESSWVEAIEASTEVTKLFEATCFLFHFISYVGELWTYLNCYHKNGNNVYHGQWFL